MRWRRGESLRLIARRLGKRGPSVRAFVLQTGGVHRLPQCRNARCLSMAEREEMSRGIAAGESSRQIAARLGRAPSTVSRELARNGGRARYRAQAADAAAFRRAQRPKPAKLALEPRLGAVVEAKLALCWSPEQIAGWLPLADPGDAVMRVSHETIYLRFPPAGGGEQRTAILASIQVGSRPVTVAATHLSNRQGHNVRQLRELQQVAGSRAAPRLLLGDLNMPSTVLPLASRRGWPETGRGRTWPNSAPTQQLDHILRNDPAGAVQPPRGQGGHRPHQRPSRLVVELDIAAS